MEDKDYIIIAANNKPLHFESGDIVIYNDFVELIHDLRHDDAAIVCIEYSKDKNGTQTATLLIGAAYNIGSFTYSDKENNFQDKLKEFCEHTDFINFSTSTPQ